MFTPQNIKKLTNVSIVTLKKFGKKYELALYPNKLFEYKQGLTKNLDEILHTKTIFNSVSKGEICSQKDIEKFKMEDNKIIEYILEYGTEQKNQKTRETELKNLQSEIIEYLKRKLLFNDRFLSYEKLLEIVKQHGINLDRDYKVQAQFILKNLSKNGYEVVPLKIKINNFNENDLKNLNLQKIISEFKKINNLKIENDIFFLKWSDLKDFKKIADKNKINYEIIEDDVEEEEIC